MKCFLSQFVIYLRKVIIFFWIIGKKRLRFLESFEYFCSAKMNNKSLTLLNIKMQKTKKKKAEKPKDEISGTRTVTKLFRTRALLFVCANVLLSTLVKKKHMCLQCFNFPFLCFFCACNLFCWGGWKVSPISRMLAICDETKNAMTF